MCSTTHQTNKLFKNHVFALQSLKPFIQNKIQIRREDIAEINSKGHSILQCLDIILGCMAFRLNDFYKEKVLETGKRGNRTIAKEKLYKHILQRIKNIYPNLNIGISTENKVMKPTFGIIFTDIGVLNLLSLKLIIPNSNKKPRLIY